MTHSFPGKRELVCELRLRKPGTQNCCLHPSRFQNPHICLRKTNYHTCIANFPPSLKKLNCKALHRCWGVAEKRDRYQNHNMYQENGSKLTSYKLSSFLVLGEDQSRGANETSSLWPRRTWDYVLLLKIRAWGRKIKVAFSSVGNHDRGANELINSHKD